MSAALARAREVGQALATCAVLGAALALFSAVRSSAFNLNGSSLALTQRDFRVFDNFTAPQANDNTTPDPNFPGATGAVLAIWKASVEWGSALHGSGDGDPTQPNGLGSGGANFDACFQGLASGVGGPDDNIHSEISGSAPGVYAFTEIPSSDGWRIRYYQNWTWSDGPGSLLPNEVDLQGVAAHEFGHAIGLDHSQVAGATMQGTIQFDAVPQRTLEADDSAGVQFLYGAAAATKPVISGVSIVPGVLTISGANFAATGNEVWFTRAVPAANVAQGDPIKFTAVISTNNGTLITLSVPQDAGPGDVMVKTPGSGNDKLSNAWPVDVQGVAPCVTPTVVCQTAPNSMGAGARIAWSGATYLSQNNFSLVANFLRPNTFGFFMASQSQTLAPFGNGFLCVGAPRIHLPMERADFFGTLRHRLDTQALPAGLTLQAGQTWYFQCIYRDVAGGGALFNLSDALSATWCP